MREDEELAAELAAVQLVEEELAWKVEESWRRERLDEVERMYEAEKKRRETEKVKGKKRKVDEDDETDEGSGKSGGKKGEGSEGPPPPMTLTIDEDVMGLLRRLGGALEKGAEAVRATADDLVEI